MLDIHYEITPPERIQENLNMILNADYDTFDSASIHAPRPFRPMLLDWYAINELFNSKQEQRESILSVRSDIEDGFTDFDEMYIEFLEGTATKEAKDIHELLTEIDGQDTLTIYRGETEYSTSYEQALSWTLDKEKASWFANRFESEEPVVYKASVKTENLLAYDNGREEQEILVHSDYLTGVEQVN